MWLMIINYNDLKDKEYLHKYFNILNTAQPAKSKRLTTSEVKVLIEFLMLPDKFENKRFGTLAKSKVVEALKEDGYSLTRANLNNKIYSLLEKGYLWKDSDSVIYPKDFVFTGAKNILKAISSGSAYDIIFRFKHDNKGS